MISDRSRRVLADLERRGLEVHVTERDASTCVIVIDRDHGRETSFGFNPVTERTVVERIADHCRLDPAADATAMPA